MSTETTPAIERMTDVLIEHRDIVCVTGDPDVVARDLLDHALNREEMARSFARDLVGRSVTTMMMRRPGESRRDHAERIGQWAAEVVLASALGVAECPICGSTRPGGTPSCDCEAHRDVLTTEGRTDG